MTQVHKDRLETTVSACDEARGGGITKITKPDPLAEALRKNLQRRKQAVRLAASAEK